MPMPIALELFGFTNYAILNNIHCKLVFYDELHMKAINEVSKNHITQSIIDWQR